MNCRCGGELGPTEKIDNIDLGVKGIVSNLNGYGQSRIIPVQIRHCIKCGYEMKITELPKMNSAAGFAESLEYVNRPITEDKFSWTEYLRKLLDQQKGRRDD